MRKFATRAVAIGSVTAGALYVANRWLRSHRTELEYGVAESAVLVVPLSGPDLAVDHERQPGVPPPSNDDYLDPYDRTDADSFPASDPPASW